MKFKQGDLYLDKHGIQNYLTVLGLIGLILEIREEKTRTRYFVLEFSINNKSFVRSHFIVSSIKEKESELISRVD